MQACSRPPSSLLLGPVWLLLLIALLSLSLPSAAGGGRPSSSSSRLSTSIFCDSPRHGVSLRVDGRFTYLSNGYVCMALDRLTPSIAYLAGDLTGWGRYGRNTLVGSGISLEVMLPSGVVVSSAKNTLGRGTEVRVDESSDDAVQLTVSGIATGVEGSDEEEGGALVLEEDWTLRLHRDSRALDFSTKGRVLVANQVLLVRHSYSLAPTSIYMLYEHGVVQMKDQYETINYYTSDDHLPLLYALGGPGATTLTAAGNVSLAIERRQQEKGSRTMLTVVGSTAKAKPWRTLFQEVVAIGGMYEGPLHRWTHHMDDRLPSHRLDSTYTWETSSRLSPNDGDFPVHGLTTGPNLPERDLRALLTGIYATPVGCITSHFSAIQDDKRISQIATGIRAPVASYDNLYNFFDPDSYLSTAALFHSGDPYIQQEARMVLERSGDFLTEGGQLPHHFGMEDPIFEAISRETMPGPNIFWVLSCFNYAKATGDLDWLASYLPKLHHASSFLFGLVDSKTGLVKVSSSLFIDTLVRANFTTDTNAMLVGFFHEFAEAETAVGNSTVADKLRSVAEGIAASVNALLWDDIDGDHFITAANPDGSRRDLVDYDANLIALAHGIVQDEDRARTVLARIDRGNCTHARATWVSEVVYQGSEDVVEGNWTGDAVCAMGRIGWFDALARRRYGDLATFEHALLEPLIADLLRWTWMHERYGCDGEPQTNRAAYYFEYPSVVVMMLRGIRYGIEMSYHTVTIRPFGPRQFSYHIGNVHVDYSEDVVTVRLGITGTRTFLIHGMDRQANYTVTAGGQEKLGSVVSGGHDGVMTFQVRVQPGVPIEVRRTRKQAHIGVLGEGSVPSSVTATGTLGSGAEIAVERESKAVLAAQTKRTVRRRRRT